MAEQDDLLLLHHLRSHACGGDCLARSRQSLSEDPGRAAGRVMSWALTRVAAHVERFGRRGWRCGDGFMPTPQESRVLAMVRALGCGDRKRAAQAAEWLVPGAEVSTLLERAAPLTSFYASERPGLRAAQA